MIRVLHLDNNHHSLVDGLAALGIENVHNTSASKAEIEQDIAHYHGIVIRSRIPIDRSLLARAKKLTFIARVGSGLENIDLEAAKELGIIVLSAPEGNSPAVGEHALGMLLSLLNKMPQANQEVRRGLWRREENRGEELSGKTIGIIGYGHTGKQFAKKLAGFDVTVLCHDIKEDMSDTYARQVPLKDLMEQADVISLHLPLDKHTLGYIDESFIHGVRNPFWLINTARGNQVVTKDLVAALKAGKILGAGLDVLDIESSSFEVKKQDTPEWSYLINQPNVLLTPHVAGWSTQSQVRMSEVLVSKIKNLIEQDYFNKY